MHFLHRGREILGQPIFPSTGTFGHGPAADGGRSCQHQVVTSRIRISSDLLAVLAGLLSGLLAGMPAGGPVDQVRAAAGELVVIGANDLGGRGLNSALTVAGSCAFAGSRGQGPVLILDVADPAHPEVVGRIDGHPRSTSRELRAVPDARLLVVMSAALGAGGVNRFDLYRWDTDCRHPYPSGGLDLGAAPHEFFLWRGPERLLLFTTFFHGGAGDLQVIDVGDPARPRPVATWDSPRGALHSISVGADGRAYLSLWTGGMLVADASDFTAGRPGPRLRLITAPENALTAPAGGNVHSAVPVPGRSLVVVTDERYVPGCPYGPARLVDVSDPAHPRALATLQVPENEPGRCAGAPPGAYTSHNPTLTHDLALISWYSAGLQVFDLADPAHPVPLAELRPAGQLPLERDRALGATAAETWSYPVIDGGMIFVADVNQGVRVIGYRGPHQEQLACPVFAEGTSNLAGPTTSCSPLVARSLPSGSPAAGSVEGVAAPTATDAVEVAAPTATASTSGWLAFGRPGSRWPGLGLLGLGLLGLGAVRWGPGLVRRLGRRD